MKTVIFGGTFNPPHFGHLKLMEAVKSAIEPEKIIILPAFAPRNRREELASVDDRLEMCRLLAEGVSGAEVSDFEAKSGKMSYTADTLEYFREECPDDRLYFAMGSDLFQNFPNWFKARRIVELAALVCVARSAEDINACKAAEETVKSWGGSCRVLECEPFVCSSTDIRGRIKRGGPTDGLLPENIAEYIKRRGLYRG